MPWEYYNDMSKEINEFFLDVYSKPSKEIDNVYVSEKLLIFDRSHPSKLDLEPETYELSLPEEFWYRLVPNYKDFLSSLEDLDTLWEMVDKKFYSIAEDIFTFDYPWSMTSGSRSYALWDFGGDRVFLGTIPDVTPPTIYCAIEKKNQREALVKLLKKSFKNGADGMIGPVLSPNFQTKTFTRDEVKSFVLSYLEGTYSWSWKDNLQETIENEEYANPDYSFMEWLTEKEKELKVSSDPCLKVFHHYSSKELSELLITDEIELTPEIKDLILEFIIDAKFNQGPWTD